MGQESQEQNEQYVPYIANYLSGFMPEKAFEWRLRAAQTGDSNSQYLVGKMYEWGNGVDMDAEKARYWYQLATEKSHFEAANALRNMDVYQESELEDELMKSVPVECRQKIKNQLDELLLEIKRQLKDCCERKDSNAQSNTRGSKRDRKKCFQILQESGRNQF